MPFYSISYSSSSYSASSSVFRGTEKLPCANEVSASKQASKQAFIYNKGLLFPVSGNFFRYLFCLFGYYFAAESVVGLSRYFFVSAFLNF